MLPAHLNASPSACPRRRILGTLDQVPNASTYCSHTEGAPNVVQDSVWAWLSSVINTSTSWLSHERPWLCVQWPKCCAALHPCFLVAMAGCTARVFAEFLSEVKLAEQSINASC